MIEDCGHKLGAANTICVNCLTRANETIKAADALAKYVQKADKRCLKYGFLPKGKVCGNIESWEGENDLSCINCKLYKVLAAYEKLRGRDGGKGEA